MNVFRIPLKFLCDVGMLNQSFKVNTNYILTLETDMQKLFETNINQSTNDLPTSVDADVHHVSTVSTEHVLRTGIKPTPYQKSFELAVLNLEWLILQTQISNSLFLLSYYCTIRATSTEVSTTVTT